MKIGQHLAKLGARVGCPVLLTRGVERWWTDIQLTVTYPLCVHGVYRVTTCRPGRRHIVAAARLQLVNAVEIFQWTSQSEFGL